MHIAPSESSPRSENLKVGFFKKFQMWVEVSHCTMQRHMRNTLQTSGLNATVSECDDGTAPVQLVLGSELMTRISQGSLSMKTANLDCSLA